MTLPARTSVASITYAVPSGSASSGDTYNITYNFLNNDEFVNVWYRNANGEKVELTLDSDFKIDISSGTNNVYGVCVLLKDVPDITSITFERSISISQDIDFNNSTLYPSITEYAFDKLTAISQDQNFKDYTIHAPSDEVVTDPRKFELPPESERLGKIVGFDGQGKVAMYAAPDGGTSYSPATRDELGLVIIGDKLSLDNMGLIDVPIASATTPGVVKVGTGIDLNDGTISVDLPGIATETTLGVVKVGDRLTVDSAGSVNVPVASSSTFGVIKVGSGVNLNDGTISVDLSTISLNAQTAKTNSETALSTATAAKVQADYAEDLADKTADLFDWYIDGAWENTNLSASSGIAGAYGNGKFVVAHSNSDRNDYSTAIRANEITWGAGILPASKDWKDVTLGTWLPGATWTSATTPPRGHYRALAAENGRLVAVGVSSKAAYSTDGGVTWTSATTPPSGYYYALAAENGRWVAVGSSKAAYSTDGGVTWTSATTLPSGYYLALAVENGRWVAVGESKAAYSTDGGVTWTSVTTPPSGDYYALVAENGRWVAVGFSKAAYSTDGGVTWTSATTPPPSGYYNALAVENGRWVAVGEMSKAAYSTDGGVTWTAATTPPTGDYSGLAVENGRWVAVGLSSKAAYSTDGGVTWTAATTPPSGDYYDLALENGRWVAVGQSSVAAYSDGGSCFVMVASEGDIACSSNAQTWQNVSAGSGSWKFIAYKNGIFSVIGDSHYGYCTGDSNWTVSSITWGETPLGIAVSENNFFVAFQNSTSLAKSTDGSSWTVYANTLPGNIEAFCFANGNLVALNNGTAYYSADEGSTWTTVTLPNTLSGDVSWAAVAYGGNRYVAIAKDNTVIYSSDLSTWHVSQYSLPTASGWCDLLYGKGKFLAINSSGTLCAFKPSIDIVDLLEGLLA